MQAEWAEQDRDYSSVPNDRLLITKVGMNNKFTVQYSDTLDPPQFKTVNRQARQFAIGDDDILYVLCENADHTYRLKVSKGWTEEVQLVQAKITTQKMQSYWFSVISQEDNNRDAWI